VRTKSGPHFKVTLHKPLEANPALAQEEQIHAWAMTMNNLYASWITEHPEQWLWLHRRWGKV
jgi:KDO2-lipid IV(A) lauroyltransferase